MQKISVLETKSLEAAQNFLNNALVSGSCPYAFKRAKQPSIEATAWAIVALLDHDINLDRNVEFLLQSQNSDGGWPTTPGEMSNWNTSSALLALRLVNHYRPELAHNHKLEEPIENAIKFVIARRTDPQVPIMRLLLLYLKGMAGLDGNGKGWAWTGNLYHWAEPTIYSLLALKLPHLADNELVRVAVSNGENYLFSHTCKDNGWNHGQYYCLGEYLPSYMLTTAEALVALVGCPDNKKLDKALKKLIGAEYEPYSAWSLAWCILALACYGEKNEDNISLLLNMQNKDGSFGSNYLTTAFAIMALNTLNGVNLFLGKYPAKNIRENKV